MKAESIALAGQRETKYRKEKVRADTALESSYWFPFVDLTSLFASQVCVRCETSFRSWPKIGALIFTFLYISRAGIQLSLLPHRIRLLTNFQTGVVSSLPPGVGGRTY